MGDELLEGGSKTGLKNTKYKEVRKFTKGSTIITFYFVTRCYGEYMKSIIAKFKTEPPDVMIMNSCLWDICRYGKNAKSEFKTNVSELLEAISLMMPCDSKRMFIWNATLPVIDTNKSSCIPFDFQQSFQPENTDVRDANLYVRDQMSNYGSHFIFLDLYNIFYRHLNHRIHDGVHWDSFAHRKITHLLLTSLAIQWDMKLPEKRNDPPTHPSDFRRTINPSLLSIPPIGSRWSLGFAPNHSNAPYQRAFPRAIKKISRSAPHRFANPLDSPFEGIPEAPMPRQNAFSPGQSAPQPRFQFPFSPTFPFNTTFLPRPRPFVFGAGPSNWRASPLNVHNGLLPNPTMNWLLNTAVVPNAKKRKWEADENFVSVNEYKRPRKFL